MAIQNKIKIKKQPHKKSVTANKKKNQFKKSQRKRKKSYEASGKYDDFFRLATEHSNDGIVIIRGDKRLYFNRKLMELLGYTDPNEFTSLPTFSTVHPDDINIVQEIARKRQKGDPTQVCYEVRLVRKDGSIVNVEISSSQIMHEGQPASLGIIRDISDRKRAESQIKTVFATLRESEEKYRTILENIEEGYFEVDLAGKFTFVNDAHCRITGSPREHLIGLSNRQYTDEITAKKLYEVFNGVYKTGEPVSGFAYEYIRRDGTKAFNEVSASLIRDAKGKPIGFRGITRDVTEHKRAEETLRQSEEKYRTMIETIQDGYFESDLTGKYTFVNDVICQRLKRSREELIGLDNRQFQDEIDAKKTYQAYHKLYMTGEPIKALDMEINRPDGTKRFSELSVSLIRDVEGKPIGFRGISRDITERKQMEQKLLEMAMHDALTGLPNRTLLYDRFDIALANAQRNKKRLAVMSLDLDKFKNVNDALGHDMGDKLLIAAADRLTGTLRKSDTVARIGGDEFILLLGEVKKKDDAVKVAQKILEDFRQPFIIDEHRLNVTVSIGIAIFPEGGKDMKDLLKSSDTSLYTAKEKGRDRFAL